VLRARLATAAVAIPLLIWLIVASPAWLFAGFILAMTAIGLGEFAAMALEGRPLAQALTVVAGLAFGAAVVQGSPNLLGLALVLVLAVGLVLSLFDPDMPGAAARLGNALVASLYVGFLLPHVVSLRLLPDGSRWVFFAVACSMGADSGGYFSGRLFGRHKLFPARQPEQDRRGVLGCAGGWPAARALCTLRLLAARARGALALLIGLAIAVLAQVGDLVESMLKRAYGAKDSGWILPGHGASWTASIASCCRSCSHIISTPAFRSAELPARVELSPMVTSIVAAIVVLGLLIFVHELGHFLACKQVG
jgi:phosphatidate cytidylyltransferase